MYFIFILGVRTSCMCVTTTPRTWPVATPERVLAQFSSNVHRVHGTLVVFRAGECGGTPTEKSIRTISIIACTRVSASLLFGELRTRRPRYDNSRVHNNYESITIGAGGDRSNRKPVSYPARNDGWEENREKKKINKKKTIIITIDNYYNINWFPGESGGKKTATAAITSCVCCGRRRRKTIEYVRIRCTRSHVIRPAGSRSSPENRISYARNNTGLPINPNYYYVFVFVFFFRFTHFSPSPSLAARFGFF